MKTYDKYKIADSHKMNNVRREIIILRKIVHENIIKLYYAFEDKKQVHLVLEYVGNISLQSYLRSQKEKKIEEKVK